MKDFDWVKYEELSSLRGISFFNTHGACFKCVFAIMFLLYRF
jgi:hypothetical protein